MINNKFYDITDSLKNYWWADDKKKDVFIEELSSKEIVGILALANVFITDLLSELEKRAYNGF